MRQDISSRTHENRIKYFFIKIFHGSLKKKEIIHENLRQSRYLNETKVKLLETLLNQLLT